MEGLLFQGVSTITITCIPGVNRKTYVIEGHGISLEVSCPVGEEKVCATVTMLNFYEGQTVVDTTLGCP